LSRQVLDVREADFLELAGAAAAVLEVHLAERVGGDLLELGVAGACPLRGRALGRRAGEGFCTAASRPSPNRLIVALSYSPLSRR
jgi:hypothetical protein